MKRCLYVVLAIAWSLATSLARADDRPNVLVIVADDLGYADLGVHGSTEIATPNIDALAAAGTRFTNGYVSGTYCSPTRAGLLTGRYQQRFGHEFNPHTGPIERRGMSVEERTMADRLGDAGYACGAIGKWHLGTADHFHPFSRGFDEFYGFLTGSHDYFKSADAAQSPIQRGHDVEEIDGYLTEVLAREAASFIDRHKSEPFFLYLCFNAVHTPMQATDKYLAKFAHIADERRRTYCAMTAALDDAVGEVLAKLHNSGLDERTLVFFISDNGGPIGKFAANGSRNDPLRGSKGDTWEGGVRVPFFVRWTGAVPAGKTLDQPVIQLDILPTALAAAHVEAHADWRLDGENLLPLLTGQSTAAPHEALYWRFGNHYAIRQGDWKVVRTWDNDRPQLFNLANDLSETTDLSAAEPERMARMLELWQRWNRELAPPAFPANHPLEGDPSARPANGAAKQAAGKRAKAAKGAPQTRAIPRGVRAVRDIEYAARDQGPLNLDLYLPRKSAGKLPVVIWVHGGGWNQGSRTRCPAVWLAGEGYAVASIDYRLTGVAQWPAQIDDCRDAIRWLRQHAGEYGLDGERIGVWGSSAGGHLVALLGTLAPPADETVSSAVQAACDWYGPTDLLTMPPNVLSEGKTRDDLANANGAKLLGGIVMDMPERARSASALYHVTSDDPPFLIVHGDQDPGVPLEQSTRLFEALESAGAPAKLHVVAGGGHGGAAFQTDEIRQMVQAFFDEHLKKK